MIDLWRRTYWHFAFGARIVPFREDAYVTSGSLKKRHVGERSWMP